MEKLAERIGLFDLWAMFFPGTIGMLEILFFICTFWSIYSKQSIFVVLQKITFDSITVWIILILISFFSGIILQEIGRWLRIKTKTSNATDIFLDPDSGIFIEKEIAILRSFLIQYGWDGKDQNCGKEIFHQINAKAQECGISEKYAKLSAIQNMSVSLSAAMLLGSIASSLLIIISLLCRRWHIALFLAVIDLLCIFLIVLFFRRAKRFNRYWVRNLVFSMSEKMKVSKNEEKRN